MENLGNRAFVRYRDFGARGDGVTNDFFAIKAAHEYANEHMLPVLAEAGKSYLIANMEVGGVAETIHIKTDTDWRGAELIFDDREIGWVEGNNKNHNTYVFTVESDYPSVKLSEDKIDAINANGGIDPEKITKIDTGLGYPALLVVMNSEVRKFIRYGGNQNAGAVQKEIILVDKDGNIDPSTPFMFPYEKVTSISAYRCDERPVTIKNALVRTRVSEINLVDKYRSMNRGIRVLRSGTRVENIEHFLTGQRDKGELVDGVPFIGHTYNCFLAVQYCTDVLVKNVSFMSHVHYLQGTYDIDATYANRVLFKDCRQKDFFTDEFPEYYNYPNIYKNWGVMGSSYCKNLEYDSCALTRYDAHSGVYNGKIINSEIASIRLIGAGDMLIENTTVYSRNYVTPIQLREDYGATWRGTVTIRNSKIVDVCKDRSLQSLIFTRSPNWDFGYVTYFPNLVIDNLEFEGANAEINLFQPFNSVSGSYFYRSVYDENLAVGGAVCSDGEVNVNPYIPPKFIRVINNEENGYEICVPDVPFFRDTELTGVKIK